MQTRTIIDSNIVIKQDNIDPCLNAMVNDERMENLRPYMMGKHGSIDNVLWNTCYVPAVISNPERIIISNAKQSRTYDSFALAMSHIFAFAEDGSYVTWKDDENITHRWLKASGKLVEQIATMVWKTTFPVVFDEKGLPNGKCNQ